jgi:hypothetical protein
MREEAAAESHCSMGRGKLRESPTRRKRNASSIARPPPASKRLLGGFFFRFEGALLLALGEARLVFRHDVAVGHRLGESRARLSLLGSSMAGGLVCCEGGARELGQFAARACFPGGPLGEIGRTELPVEKALVLPCPHFGGTLLGRAALDFRSHARGVCRFSTTHGITELDRLVVGRALTLLEKRPERVLRVRQRRAV